LTKQFLKVITTMDLLEISLDKPESFWSMNNMGIRF